MKKITQQKRKRRKNFHLWELFSLRVGIACTKKAPTKARFFIFFYIFWGLTFSHLMLCMFHAHNHTHIQHIYVFFCLLLFTYTAHLHIFHPQHSDVSHTMCQFQPSDKFCFLFFRACLFVCLCHVRMYWCWVCVGSQYEDICGCVWMSVNPLMMELFFVEEWSTACGTVWLRGIDANFLYFFKHFLI